MADEDPIDALVARLMSDGEVTFDAFTEGRRFGAFYAGLRSGSGDMQQELTMSGAIALTETWMTGGVLVLRRRR